MFSTFIFFSFSLGLYLHCVLAYACIERSWEKRALSKYKSTSVFIIRRTLQIAHRNRFKIRPRATEIMDVLVEMMKLWKRSQTPKNEWAKNETNHKNQQYNNKSAFHNEWDESPRNILRIIAKWTLLKNRQSKAKTRRKKLHENKERGVCLILSWPMRLVLLCFCHGSIVITEHCCVMNVLIAQWSCFRNNDSFFCFKNIIQLWRKQLKLYSFVIFGRDKHTREHKHIFTFSVSLSLFHSNWNS